MQLFVYSPRISSSKASGKTVCVRGVCVCICVCVRVCVDDNINGVCACVNVGHWVAGSTCHFIPLEQVFSLNLELSGDLLIYP